MKRFFLISALGAQTLSADIERVHAHFLVQDRHAAYEEARGLLALEPNSPRILEAAVKAAARTGKEREAIEYWKRYLRLEKAPYENRALLEELGWGVIEEGMRSSLPIVRVTATVGAFYGQDARGVSLLVKAMEDPNTYVRAAALQLAANLRDTKLKKKALQLFREEKTAAVKIQAVAAVGKMKAAEAMPELMAMLADDRAQDEMKAAAIEAIVSLKEGIERSELLALANSPRAGLRQLACLGIRFFNCTEDADLLLPLFNDPHADVRRRAVIALGSLRIGEVSGKEVVEILRGRLNDSNPSVAIASAWALTLWDDPEGQEAWGRFLNHHVQKVRIEAAAALAASGKHGTSIARRAFYEVGDPYVRLNLAYGLLLQREETGQVCEALYHCPKMVRGRMMREEGEFRAIVPSTLHHNALVPNHPEAVDQQVRLELLNALAIMGDPRAFEAVKSFLQERNWGISGAASALLLTEGDESAVKIVEKLLDDPNAKVRIQAGLILSLWGEGERAFQVLEGAYDGADREMKAHILEGMGSCRSEKTVPFLVEKLDEPYPTLRIIAAAALLHHLYL